MGSKYSKAYPLASLHNFMRMKKIDVEPWYQRQSVWSKPQKRLLIDSVLRGYDIPKVYFRKVSRPPTEWEVVDGHQRLDSIYEFFEDSYSLADDADPVDGIAVAGQHYSELHSDIQLKLQTEAFDVVILENYSEDEIEDMFGRFQNGTPLNAPEKRRVIPGSMRQIVEQISKHKAIGDLANYKNKRYAFEDVAAKLIHLTLAGKIVDVRAESLKKTYAINASLRLNDPAIARLKRGLNFLHSALKHRPIKLSRIMSYMLPTLVLEIAREYDIYQHGSEFGAWYLAFETERAANNSKEPDDPTRDVELDRFTDSLRNDSVQALTYIENVLRRSLFEKVTDLSPLDPNRDFSEDQRFFIYQRDKGICQAPGCGKSVELDSFHADHITLC